MSGTNQKNEVAPVSVNNQALIGNLLHTPGDGIGLEEMQGQFRKCQELLLPDAQYMEPTETAQRVCDLPAQRIALQKEITDLKSQHFPPPNRDHPRLDERIQHLEHNLAEVRRRPAVE